MKSCLIKVLVIFFSGAGVATAQPLAKNFVSHLSGHEEVPPVESRAQGQSFYQLGRDGTELRFSLKVANIDEITQAHIHCGVQGVNGPVVVFLFGLVPTGVTLNGILADGTITNANVLPRPDSEVCPGGIANFDELIQKMRSGDTYTNVHTLEHTGGEIRGQIMPAGPRR